MREKMGSASAVASAGAARHEDKKAKDRAEFMEKWLAYGFHLKNRADAHGVEWRGKSFETWEAEIVFAEEFSKPDQVME